MIIPKIRLRFDAKLERSGMLQVVLVPMVLALLLCAAAMLVDALTHGSLRSIIIAFVINGILAIGLQAFVGTTGIMSFGHIAFMAVGAYATGLATVPASAKKALLPNAPQWLQSFQVPFVVGVLIGAAVATFLALLVGPVLMRLTGAAASAASIGLLVIVTDLIANADSLTKGTQTFSGVPKATSLWLLAAGLIIATGFSAWMKFARVGLRARSAGDDELAAQASGVGVTASRIPPFLLSAAITGAAGGLFAGFLTAFSPNTFGLVRGVIVIVIVVLGGTGSIAGTLLAAAVISIFGELMRQFEDGANFGPVAVPAIPTLSDLALGLLLILVLILRPKGFLGTAEIEVDHGESGIAKSPREEVA